MKKSNPRKNASLKNIVNGIKEGKYYTNALTDVKNNFRPVHGLEYMTVDINAADFFDYDNRYTIQKVTVPLNKRGNLSKYKGQKVEIIPTTIARAGARINFYIRAIK